MHVVVWEAFYGKITKGFHVHHIDGDKSNNCIYNLKLLSIKQHVNAHFSEEKREAARKHVANIRPLTKEWHSSENGRKWHKDHGIDGWNKKKEITKKCKVCEKEFKTKTYHQLFCSNKCKSSWRRASGLDIIEVKCEFCKNIFTKSRYSKATCCSKSCGRTLSWQKSKEYKILRESGRLLH